MIKQLAESFVDGEIKSQNRDQLLADYVKEKFPSLSIDERDEKFFSIERNFDEYQRRILRDRQKAEQRKKE